MTRAVWVVAALVACDPGAADVDASPVDSEADTPVETDGEETVPVESDTVDAEESDDSDPVESDTVDSEESDDSDPVESDDTDTDLVAPPETGESDPHSDPPTEPTETGESDPPTDASDSGDTLDASDDTVDTPDDTVDPPDETAAPPDDTAPPPAPTCLFQHRVIMPTDLHRSIDLQGSALNGYVWPVDVNDGDTRRELAVTLPARYGIRWVFLDVPTSGLVPWQQLVAAERVGDLDRSSSSATQQRRFDLDGDGRTEWFPVVTDYPSPGVHCAAYTVTPGVDNFLQPGWRFLDGTTNTDADDCMAGDFNHDGADDVWVTVRRLAGGFDQYWVEGPIPPGDVDLTTAASVTGSWPAPAFGPGWHGWGDFNGDGVTDFFVTQPQPGAAAWELAVYFGPLAAVLDTSRPDVVIRNTVEALSSVQNVGDVDGDGTDDLIGAAMSYPMGGLAGSGAAYLYKGPLRRGQVLTEADADTTITWPHVYATTGATLAPLGDLDGDGRPEFGVAAWARRSLTPPSVDLTPTWPPSAGPIVSPLSSWDSGGLDTAVVVDTGFPGGIDPWPFGNAEGAIMIFSDPPAGVVGPNEAKLLILGDRPGDMVGGWWGFSDVGDLDGDGVADLAYGAVGAPDATIRVLFPCADLGGP